MINFLKAKNISIQSLELLLEKQLAMTPTQSLCINFREAISCTKVISKNVPLRNTENSLRVHRNQNQFSIIWSLDYIYTWVSGDALLEPESSSSMGSRLVGGRGCSLIISIEVSIGRELLSRGCCRDSEEKIYRVEAERGYLYSQVRLLALERALL